MRRWVDWLVEGKAMICTKLKERRPRYDANLILGEPIREFGPETFGRHERSTFSKLFVLARLFPLLEHIFLKTATIWQSPSIYNQ
jgi:hypothetical protein